MKRNKKDKNIKEMRRNERKVGVLVIGNLII